MAYVGTTSTHHVTAYGNFFDFCRDSTIPVCNLFLDFRSGPGTGDRSCPLTGIPLGGSRYLRNLGVIILDGIAILTALILLWRTQRKRAAVGRREMQLFLLGFIILSICEIFTVGGIPLDSDIRIAFTGAHIAIITSTCWMLMLNGAVGYQLVDDGSFPSVFLVLASTTCIFVGTGFVALDTGYNWTGYFNTALIQFSPNREYALYTLYFLCPAFFLFVYFVLASFIVLKVLGEIKPMLFLLLAVLLFAIGQVFDFVISVHICHGVSGKIDGSLFQTLFTLLAVTMVWSFWSSITEDDWPAAGPTGSIVEGQHGGHHQQMQQQQQQYMGPTTYT